MGCVKAYRDGGQTQRQISKKLRKSQYAVENARRKENLYATSRSPGHPCKLSSAGRRRLLAKLVGHENVLFIFKIHFNYLSLPALYDAT